MYEKPDPELRAESPESVTTALIKPQARKPYDPDVTFEEYHYYAQKTRAEELTYESPVMDVRRLLHRGKGAKEDPHAIACRTNLTAEDFTSHEKRIKISDEEWTNASRSLRTASWGACKYPIGTSSML